MKHILILAICTLSISYLTYAQDAIPFDTSQWSIVAQGHIVENFKGQKALYLQNGNAQLKDIEFLNGTIEFDIYLEDRRSFPGIRFRAYASDQMELFYFRPHLSGKPDCNQAIPVFGGMSAWQLYFGPKYSFAYDYKLDDWTHVKIVVNENQAQIYLDHSKDVQLSWQLKQKVLPGSIILGSSLAPVHFANVQVKPNEGQISNFSLPEKEIVSGIISAWTVSDKFDENDLNMVDKMPQLIKSRQWLGQIEIEETNAINISRLVSRPTQGANTVFAKLTINSDATELKYLDFGYSDRVVVILNGQPIYRGNNNFRSRDYRYLGTIGLFDGVYLPLQKGENTLLMAVSESFGGWAVMGAIENRDGIQIQ